MPEDTSAAKTNFRQKRGRLSTSFEFNDNTLGYTFQNKSGTKIQRQIPWLAVPSDFYYQNVTERDGVIIWLCAVLTVLSFVAVITHLGEALQAFAFYAAFTAILLGIAFALRRLWKTEFTIIVAENTNLIVFRDKLHDPIIGEIGRRRQNALLRYAVINPQQTVRQNLRRFQQLVREKAVTPETFAGVQNTLVPKAEQSLLKPAFPGSGSDMHFAQNRMGAACVFDFQRIHFRYQRKTVINGQRSFNIRYDNLPNKPGSVDQIAVRNPFVLFFVAWAYIGLVAVLNFMSEIHPESYYKGSEGLKRLALAFGPVLIAFFVALAVAKKLGKSRYTQILPKLLIYIDGQHDAILAEIEKRRRDALKWYAEPDPLLTVQEQTNILSNLKQNGIISEEELQANMAQAAATQNYLGLDNPPDAQPAVETRPTLH